jgi:hypothetical protein
MLSNDAASKRTNYADAFRMFNNVCRRKSICFLISDFLGKGFEDALRVASRKHDVIGIKIYDQLDMRLPDAGLLQVADAETGEQRWIDTSKHNDYVKEVFRRSGADLLHMRAGDDYVKVLQKFFINRSR